MFLKHVLDDKQLDQLGELEDVSLSILSYQSPIIPEYSEHQRLFVIASTVAVPILVGGFKHFLFSIIYGIILPID